MHRLANRLAHTPLNMLHLHTERLAALGHELPSSDEAAHLAVCAECAGERRAYQNLVAMAYDERGLFGLPLTRWDAIAAKLDKPATRVSDVAPGRRSNRLLRIAAGVVLVAGGALAGRASAIVRPPIEGAGTVAFESAPNAGAESAVQFTTDSAAFTSVNGARAAQQRSEVIYQQAAEFLARFDTSAAAGDSPVAVHTRLAALDQMISTTREAMRQAPHDPVINGYYLTTLGQREATLRQLNTALPASLRATSDPRIAS